MKKNHHCRLFLPMLILLLPGCGWHRTIVNEDVMKLDAEWIEVGQTTWMEVLEKLGPPQDTESTTQILNAKLNQNVLKYVCYDAKTTSLTLSLGAYLQLPFHWTDEQKKRELVVEFDGNGKVIGVYDSHTESIWRPLSNEDDRSPPTLTIRGA